MVVPTKWPHHHRDHISQPMNQSAIMNSYFEQSGFYGQGGAGAAPDYRFPIGLSSLGGVGAYGHNQPRPPQDPGYEAPASPSKSSLYSSLSDPSPYRF